MTAVGITGDLLGADQFSGPSRIADMRPVDTVDPPSSPHRGNRTLCSGSPLSIVLGLTQVIRLAAEPTSVPAARQGCGLLGRQEHPYGSISSSQQGHRRSAYIHIF